MRARGVGVYRLLDGLEWLQAKIVAGIENGVWWGSDFRGSDVVRTVVAR